MNTTTTGAVWDCWDWELVLTTDACFPPRPRSTTTPTEHGASCSTFWLTTRKPWWPGSMLPSDRCALWNGSSTSAAIASSAQMHMSLCMSGNDDRASSRRTFTLAQPPHSDWYASSASPMSFRISDTSSSTTVTPSNPPPFTMAAAVWSVICTMSTAYTASSPPPPTPPPHRSASMM